MNISEINIVELQKNELELITGGDSITRAVFSWLGSMAAVITNAMASDAELGATGHI
ncbi:hypothetical protein ACFX5F_13765 [Flavobacterium sp. ZS1P70]|uniref:Bacteriocin n=1 Tax=Flavobacterium zhoui TaxID=3230414 RepID=A0ABW6I7P4_9FLAO